MPRIFLTALLSHDAVGFLYDRGEKLLVPENLQPVNGERFWARGYAVSTVGFEEEQIRASIKRQEQLDAQGSEESGEF